MTISGAFWAFNDQWASFWIYRHQYLIMFWQRFVDISTKLSFVHKSQQNCFEGILSFGLFWQVLWTCPQNSGNEDGVIKNYVGTESDNARRIFWGRQPQTYTKNDAYEVRSAVFSLGFWVKKHRGQMHERTNRKEVRTHSAAHDATHLRPIITPQLQAVVARESSDYVGVCYCVLC